jgi:hypothetical protein
MSNKVQNFDDGAIVRVSTGYSLFVGELLSKTDNTVVISSPCQLIPKPTANKDVNWSIVKLRSDVEIKGSMTIELIPETEELYAKYRESISSLILPLVNIREVANLDEDVK